MGRDYAYSLRDGNGMDADPTENKDQKLREGKIRLIAAGRWIASQGFTLAEILAIFSECYNQMIKIHFKSLEK